VADERRWGSDVIAEMIRALGIEYIAINPGATYRGLHDSFVNHLGDTRPQLLLCHHEEIAVAIAHGYNKASGKLMGAFVHNIVGLLHASMAVFNAYTDRAGLLLFGATGPVDAAKRRAWIDWIHTANVQGQAVRDFVKWDDQPHSVEAALESLVRAHRLASAHPQGPVYVNFDAGIQEEELDREIALPDPARFPQPSRLQADTEAIEQTAGLLAGAQRPVLVAGYLGRSQEAVDALRRLAERLQAPVVDIDDLFNFPTHHPLWANDSAQDILAEADVVVAMDVYDLQQSLTNLEGRTRVNQPIIPPTAKLVDISLRHQIVRSWADVQGSLFPTHLSIAADTSLAVPALADALARRLDDADPLAEARAKRRTQLAALHQKGKQEALETARATAGEAPMHLAHVANTLWDAVRKHDWVLANGDLRGWIRRIWDFQHPYQNADSRGGGGLGRGLGLAIGVALANRDSGRLTVNVQSDGDMLFTPAAIHTAVRYDIPHLIVMHNNRTYGNDLGHQGSVAQTRSRDESRRNIGIDITDPDIDYAGMARSFGAWAEGPITDPAELAGALERAIHEVTVNRRVALVDVITQWR
jgi:acetolactate synthase-1/2/3 large subunit